MAFAWEPVGNKFAFIHGENPRIGVSVYFVQKGGSLELISECMHSPTLKVDI